MFTAVTLMLAMGAPVPPAQPPVPSGPAPLVLDLKPNADGKIMMAVTRTEMQRVTRVQAVAVPPGGVPMPQQVVTEVPVRRRMIVELGDVKDLAISTADGKKLDREEALKKLAKGGVVVVSTDGNAVSPLFLKVFKDDTLVLTSPELIGTQINITGPSSRPILRPLQPAPGAILPLAPAGPAIPVQGGIQIQVVPALPAPAAGPAVAPAQQAAPMQQAPIPHEKKADAAGK